MHGRSQPGQSIPRRWLARSLALVAAAGFMAATLRTLEPPDGFLKGWRASGASAEGVVPTPAVKAHPATASADRDDSKSRTLRLVAAEPGRNAGEGRARLGIGTGPTQTYVAGALLANGARLVEIHSGYVILERRGERQWLSMGAIDIEGDVLTVGSPQMPSARPPSREPITDTIRMTPVYEGETLRGYRVFPGSHAEAFAALGLHSGDVITALDGAALDDREKAALLFRRLTTRAAVVATVERENQSTAVTLDGSVLKTGKSTS